MGKITDALKVKPEIVGKIKIAGGGLICGAVVAMVIGFMWGGWATAGTVQKMSDKAVLSSQATICAAQFMNDPTSKEKLGEFETLDENSRRDLIQKGSWDKMPGQKEASSGVAQECSYELEDIMRK